MSGSAWDDPTRNIAADIVAVVRDAADAGSSTAAGMDAAMTRAWDESYSFNREDFEAAVAKVRERWSRPYEPPPLPDWVRVSYILDETAEFQQAEATRRYFLNDTTTARPRDATAWKRVPRRTVYGGPVTEGDLDVDGEQVAADFAALQGGARPPTGRAPHAHAGTVLPGDVFTSRARANGKSQQAEETLRAWSAEFTRLYGSKPNVVEVGTGPAASRPGRRFYGELPAALDPDYRADPSTDWLDLEPLLEEMRSRSGTDQYLLQRRHVTSDMRIVADTRYGVVAELGSPITGDASPGTSASS